MESLFGTLYDTASPTSSCMDGFDGRPFQFVAIKSESVHKYAPILGLQSHTHSLSLNFTTMQQCVTADPKMYLCTLEKNPSDVVNIKSPVFSVKTASSTRVGDVGSIVELCMAPAIATHSRYTTDANTTLSMPLCFYVPNHPIVPRTRNYFDIEGYVILWGQVLLVRVTRPLAFHVLRA